VRSPARACAVSRRPAPAEDSLPWTPFPLALAVAMIGISSREAAHEIRDGTTPTPRRLRSPARPHRRMIGAAEARSNALHVVRDLGGYGGPSRDCPSLDRLISLTTCRRLRWGVSSNRTTSTVSAFSFLNKSAPVSAPSPGLTSGYVSGRRLARKGLAARGLSRCPSHRSAFGTRTVQSWWAALVLRHVYGE
jgi:hypothetical protein